MNNIDRAVVMACGKRGYIDAGTVLLCAAALVWGLARPAVAQQASAEPELEEVQVTGSRIIARDLQGNSPILTVSPEALTNISQATVDEALKRLPQLAASSGQNSGARAPGDAGLATINLRNLGTNRNLVLLDGRRMQPASTNFSVDTNTVPSALVQSVEIVSGGASAVYGSDAISGVVNFKLRTDFEGLEVSAKLGTSERGDYNTQDVSLLAGTNMADGRGNLVFGLNYTKRGKVLARDIPFVQEGLASGRQTNGFLGWGFYTQPNAQLPGSNRPDQAVVAAQLGGSVPATSAIGFNSDGTTLFGLANGRNYNSGLFPDDIRYATTPSGGIGYNRFYGDYASTPMDRYSGFARATMQLGEHVEAYMQGMYSHYTINSTSSPSALANFWNAWVPHDAAHPTNAAFEVILNSRPDAAAPWSLDRAAEFSGLVTVRNTNNNFQVLAGLKGDIGGTSLKWDAYASHGQTDVTQIFNNQISTTRHRELIAAPFYGAGFQSGTYTCTSGISPFLQGPVSQDCLDYLRLSPRNVTTQEQDVVEGTLQGPLFSLPAGDVLFAVGAGYRKNTFSNDMDDSWQTNPLLCAACAEIPANLGTASTAGSTDVSEVFGELIVPLLQNLPLVRSLELGLAYRYSDYDTIGGVNTWKADMNWALSDTFRVRGGFQRAVRAPNPVELFSGQTGGFATVTQQHCVNAGPFAAGVWGNNAANPNVAQVRALCAALTPDGTVGFYTDPYFGGGTVSFIGTTQGNPDLQQETADTVTAGIVFQSQELWFDSRFSASVDYYRIKLEGAIGSKNALESYNLCFNRDGLSNPVYDPAHPACQSIIIGAAAQGALPISVTNYQENQGGIKTDGVDVATNLSLPVGPGMASLMWQGTFLLSFERSLNAGTPFIEYGGYSNNFDIRSLVTAAYAWGDLDVGTRWRYLSSSKDNSCAGITSCTVPDTASYNLIDLYGNFRLTDTLSFNAGIDNLLDKDPPVITGIPGNTNSGEYDVLGRKYYVGIKARF